MGEPREFEAQGSVGRARRGPPASVLAVAAVAIGLVVIAVGGRLTAPSPSRSVEPSSAPLQSPAVTVPRPPTDFSRGAELTAIREIMFVGGGLIPPGAHLIVLGAGVARGVPAYQVESVAFTNYRADRGPAQAGWVAAELLGPNVKGTVVGCPNGPLDPTILARLTGHERLRCLRGQNVTVGPGLLRLADPGLDARHLWLTADNVGGLPVYGTDAKTLDRSLRDRWVMVSGRFDDPARAGCSGRIQAECRERFVVTAITRSMPPDGMMTGTWTVHDAAFALRPSASVAVTDRGLFAWGGERDASGRRDGPQGGVFDVATAWRPIAAAPIPVRDFPVAVWTRSRVIVIGGVVSGTGGDAGARRDGAAYDPARNRWERIADAPFPVGPAAAVLTEPGRIVVAENVNVASAGRHLVALYDVDRDRWTALPALPLETDDSAQLLALGGRPVLVKASGGADGGIYMLDGVADAWRRISDVPSAMDQLVALGDRLVGVAVNRTEERRVRTSVDAFDPATGAWSVGVPEDDDWSVYGIVPEGDHLVVAATPWRYVDAARGDVTRIVPPPEGVEPGRVFGVVERNLVALWDDADGRSIAVTFRPDNPSAFGGEPR